MWSMQLFKIFQSTETDLGFEGTYTITPRGEETPVTLNFTVFDDATFRQLAGQLYGLRNYAIWYPGEYTEAELVADFVATFALWKNSRMDTYMRRCYALSLQYDPISNYDSHEVGLRTLTHGEKVEQSFDGRKDVTTDDSFTERTYTDYEETEKDDHATQRTYNSLQTAGGAVTDEHKISADDATDYVAHSQDIKGATTETTTGGYTDAKSFTNGNVKTIDGKIKDAKGFDDGHILEKQGKEIEQHSGDDKDNHTLEKWGNVGVTTTQQMLESDLDLLKRDITMDAIREFIDRFTYFSEEVD